MWDATVVDTLAPSHLPATSVLAGSAASLAEESKRKKYVGNLSPTYEFLPLGFETLGGMGTAAREFVDVLSKRLVEVTGSERAGYYFIQRLSLEILRGNAGSILGSVQDESSDLVGGVLHGDAGWDPCIRSAAPSMLY